MKSLFQFVRHTSIVALVLNAVTVVHAKTAATRTAQLAVPHVFSAPTLSDYLDGRERPQELRISDFRQRDPYDGEPAISRTTAYISHDENNIYAVFVCKDVAGRLALTSADETTSQVMRP